jgi:hypothetical protein
LERRGGYNEYWAAADALEFSSGAFEGRVISAADRALGEPRPKVTPARYYA